MRGLALVWRLCLLGGIGFNLGGLAHPHPALVWERPLPAVITPENAAHLEVWFEKDFGPWNLATALAWSADGRWLAVGVGEAVVLFETGSYTIAADVHLGALTNGLAFHPTRALLAAASRDGMVRLWDAASLAKGEQTPLWQVPAHRKGANTVVFRPDGVQLVSGGSDGLARFWQVSDGGKLNYIIGGAFATPNLAFLPDGRLALVSGPHVRLRESETERILGDFLADANLYSLATSPDGQWLAAGGLENRVLLWQTAQAFKTGVKDYPQLQALIAHTGRRGYRSLIWQVNFSPDGRLLVSAGGDGSVWLWSVTPPQSLAQLGEHSLGATSAVFDPQGRWLATAGLDGVLRIWAAARP